MRTNLLAMDWLTSEISDNTAERAGSVVLE